LERGGSPEQLTSNLHLTERRPGDTGDQNHKKRKTFKKGGRELDENGPTLNKSSMAIDENALMLLREWIWREACKVEWGR